MGLFDKDQDAEKCSTNALDFFLFVLSLVLLCLPWWVFEIPKLFVKSPPPSPDGFSFRPFYHSVGWNCGRLLAPSYFAIIAMGRSTNPKSWPVLYYFGYDPVYEEGDKVIRPFTAFQWLKVTTMDLVVHVAHILLLYRGGVLSRQEGTNSPTLGSFWLFGTLPPGIVGLCLIAAAALPWSIRPSRLLLYMMSVLALLGTAFIVASVFTAGLFLKSDDRSFVAGPILFWILLSSPIHLTRCLGGQWHLLFYLLNAMARTSPMLAAILADTDTFVFCGKSPKALAIVYGLLGGALMWTFCPVNTERTKNVLVERHRKSRDRPWDARARDDDDEEEVALQAGDAVHEGADQQAYQPEAELRRVGG